MSIKVGVKDLTIEKGVDDIEMLEEVFARLAAYKSLKVAKLTHTQRTEVQYEGQARVHVPRLEAAGIARLGTPARMSNHTWKSRS